MAERKEIRRREWVVTIKAKGRGKPSAVELVIVESLTFGPLPGQRGGNLVFRLRGDGRSVDPDLKASPNGCEEASQASVQSYIPCNQPAVALIWSERDQRTYRMCAACADHNVRNRGMTHVGDFHARKEY